MTDRTVRWWPWILWAVATGCGVAAVALVEQPDLIEEISFIPTVSVMAGVGALVLSRHKGHPLGRLLMVTGAVPMFGRFGETYAILALKEGMALPLAVPVAMVAGFWFPVLFTALSLFLLKFPDGKYLSARWRIFGRVVIGVFVIGLFHVFKPGQLSDGSLPAANPLGIEAVRPFFALYSSAWFFSTILAMVVSIAGILRRFARAHGEERQQLKWIAYGASLLAGAAVIDGIILDGILDIDSGAVGSILFAGTFMSIPVGAGIAIAKYRLYDIDIVINKTIVYGALAAFITAVYVGVVVGIGSIVGSSDRPNIALSLTATAIVAIAFQPVRLRVQRFANKLVYGERVTPYEAITGFSHRIAETLTFDQVLPQMAEAAAKGVGAISSRVTLIQPNGDRQGFTHGDASHSFFQVPVIHQGEEVGEIAVAKAPGEQLTKAEQDLLKDLASQAGLAMRNLRLTAELQAKLEELQASRKRIVKAQDEERRRMERDIHDGAQQQLVAMSVKLGLVTGLLDKDTDKASQLLDDLRLETSSAVETLRDLARGVFPQVLVDSGLVPALQSHINKSQLPATIEDRLDGARFDPEIETNIYFCIREALQNASKHAPGAPITITLDGKEDHLRFEVKDEGPGFDAAQIKMGSGLNNIKDRVEALGGTFELDGSSGTCVSSTIPARAMEAAS